MNVFDDQGICVSLHKTYQRYLRGDLCEYFADGIEMTYDMIIASRLHHINQNLHDKCDINGMILRHKIVIAINKRKGSRLHHHIARRWFEIVLRCPKLKHISQWYMQLEMRRGTENQMVVERREIIKNLEELLSKVQECIAAINNSSSPSVKKRSRSQINRPKPSRMTPITTPTTMRKENSMFNLITYAKQQKQKKYSLDAAFVKPRANSQPEFVDRIVI